MLGPNVRPKIIRLLEKALTISQLTRKSTAERTAATLIFEVLRSTEGGTAAEVSVMASRIKLEVVC